MTDSYNADSITILEGLDVVRKRPGMYIGSTGERGLHHMVWEVVDNAVDEAMAGHATRVDVTLLADGGVEVVDDGRGIPVAMHATGIPTVEVVMTQLHAGGKFDSDSYSVSGGLHGVGVSVVNALSTRLEVDIRRDGHRWSQTYRGSVPGTLVKGEPTSETGTTVRFWADPDIFEVTSYSAETVARRLQEMAFLNRGLTLTLGDLRDSAPTERRTFHYPDGLVDFVKHINRTREPIQAGVVGFCGAVEGLEVEVAMQWNAG
ncbi:ATP-binding protein, partial [Mycolicibacterium vaccae]|uniref:ATP-binding protein n=1 Tax=Mycolicibacterium vaccae TaxID=1810 RepID=UPI003CF01B96